MVNFTCNHCGESLKKQAVEKHYAWQRCKGAQVFVTCIDCHKDFGQEYVSHTKCISEAERYYGKDYQAKPSQNKGQKKQEAWTDMIQNVLQRDDLTGRIRGVLQQLTKHENVPRKKAKFLNFMKNVSKQTSEYDATRIFDLIEEAFNSAKATSESGQKNGHGEEVNGKNEKSETEEPKVKKQKLEKNLPEDESAGKEDNKQVSQELPQEKLDSNSIEKKSKKKRKHEDNGNSLEVNLPETPLTVPEDNSAEKKGKAKKKKKQSNNDSNQQLPENEICQELPSEEKLDTNSTDKKSKKKRKHEENGNGLEDAPPEENSAHEKSKKKRKNKETSVNPEDEKRDEPQVKTRKEIIKEIKESTSDGEADGFPWKEEITKILEKNENSMDLAKLQKRILKKYKKAHPENVNIETRIGLYLTRRLRKMKTITVQDDLVTLKV